MGILADDLQYILLFYPYNSTCIISYVWFFTVVQHHIYLVEEDNPKWTVWCLCLLSGPVAEI